VTLAKAQYLCLKLFLVVGITITIDANRAARDDTVGTCSALITTCRTTFAKDTLGAARANSTLRIDDASITASLSTLLGSAIIRGVALVATTVQALAIHLAGVPAAGTAFTKDAQRTIALAVALIIAGAGIATHLGVLSANSTQAAGTCATTLTVSSALLATCCPAATSSTGRTVNACFAAVVGVWGTICGLATVLTTGVERGIHAHAHGAVLAIGITTIGICQTLPVAPGEALSTHALRAVSTALSINNTGCPADIRLGNTHPCTGRNEDCNKQGGAHCCNA